MKKSLFGCGLSTLGDFNLFETLNLVNAEIRHSNVLGWLLDPNENHGTGQYFLNLFIKHFISENKSVIDHLNVFDIELLDYKEVEIRREWKNIDILIIINENNKKLVIAIENKIRSSEHSDQLQRYREIIGKEFENYAKLFIYLTPESTIPSDENWINFNYSTIADLIDTVVNSKKEVLNENIINFIVHYNRILKRYIVGNSEIEIICKQIYKKHKSALDLIFQYKPDIDSDVSDYVQSLINANNDLKMDNAGKTVVRFMTNTIEKKIPKKSEGWSKSKILLAYEFYNFDKKLVLRLYIGPGEQKPREELFDHFSKRQTLFPLTKRALSKKWHCVFQKEFIKKKDYEEMELEDLQEIIKQKWDEFIKKELIEIDKYIESWQST